MDPELEELESLVSEHFGRTPLTTPCASQETYNSEETDHRSFEPDEEIEFDILESTEIQSVVDYRVLDFLDQITGEDDTKFLEDETTYEATYDLHEHNVAMLTDFMNETCCSKDCYKQFTREKVYQHILTVTDMGKDEKELYVMGILSKVHDSEKTSRGKERRRKIVQYSHSGNVICKKAFSQIYSVGPYALESIVKHLKTEGATQRVHGNSKKKPHHAISYEDVKRIVEFISNVADEQGMPHPGAPRGRDNLSPNYLPSVMTKVQMHKDYTRICHEAGVRAVKHTCFFNIWSNCLPHIRIAKPREDVCAVCEKHRQNVRFAFEENENVQALTNFLNHWRNAQTEKNIYNECIRAAKETHHLCPGERTNHYTFDFAQNVALPHFARQMGPMYFSVLRKVHVFGVRIDGKPKQLNFLIDEAETIGKDGSQSHGPNSVISMLDHVLETYGRNETRISLHADNCPGQNKNRYVLGYLMWRVMRGKQASIEYMMQVPGHGHCLVDSGFGLLKKLYKRSDVETMDELTTVVTKSSSTNEAVRYPAWKWRNWKNLLEPQFKALPGISKFQYFRMDREDLGWVTVREGSGEPEKRIKITSVDRLTDDMPEEIAPAGLTEERQRYLRKTVAPFMTPNAREAVYPECEP